MDFVKERGVQAVFHYIPLHDAPAGRRYGRFAGEDRFTTRESGRLLRLPLYYGLSEAEVAQVVEAVAAFYGRANS
jgi:dTDP-4-amino-4,6-dideoxygalactose transaminase